MNKCTHSKTSYYNGDIFVFLYFTRCCPACYMEKEPFPSCIRRDSGRYSVSLTKPFHTCVMQPHLLHRFLFSSFVRSFIYSCWMRMHHSRMRASYVFTYEFVCVRVQSPKCSFYFVLRLNLLI